LCAVGHWSYSVMRARERASEREREEREMHFASERLFFSESCFFVFLLRERFEMHLASKRAGEDIQHAHTYTRICMRARVQTINH